MIDIEAEKPLSLTEAARRLPGKPHISTLHRWILRGLKGVKLETVFIGGRRYTSIEAMQRFADRLTGEQVLSSSPPPRSARTRKDDQVERELQALGL